MSVGYVSSTKKVRSFLFESAIQKCSQFNFCRFFRATLRAESNPVSISTTLLIGLKGIWTKIFVDQSLLTNTCNDYYFKNQRVMAMLIQIFIFTN